MCEDIDECSENLHNCPQHSECNNTLGNYTCLCHTGFTQSAHSTCQVAPEKPTVSPSVLPSTILVVGSNLTLTCTSTDSGSFLLPFTYCWRKDGAAFTPDSSSSELRLTGMTSLDEGSYTCFVTAVGVRSRQSEPYRVELVRPGDICPCECRTPALDNASLSDAVTRLTKRLVLDPNILSRKVRTKTSAQDDRPSSKAAGSVAIIFLSVCFCMIVLADACTLVQYIASKIF
ncbi:uncharacterized protein LOC101850108 [Aplysia californica]|uniref:Uncharacterized protein LOC101850108 n=1 Tax=Aplysia californica TaxID=6500 RepID=A0ABM1VZ68_APLCA|nr:uncharacterized protein LOC101850108 [Aplysia californica]